MCPTSAIALQSGITSKQKWGLCISEHFSLATRATNQSAGRNLKYPSRQLMLKSPKPKWRSVSWRSLRREILCLLSCLQGRQDEWTLFSLRVTATWTGPGRVPLRCVGCMRVSLHQTLLGNGSVATWLLWAFWLIWRNSHFHGYGLHLTSMLILWQVNHWSWWGRPWSLPDVAHVFQTIMKLGNS